MGWNTPVSVAAMGSQSRALYFGGSAHRIWLRRLCQRLRTKSTEYSIYCDRWLLLHWKQFDWLAPNKIKAIRRIIRFCQRSTSKPSPHILFRLPVLLFRVFQQKVYRRIGWRRRFLPPHCDWSPSLQCFPVNLVDDSPLPRKRLGHYSYPVPMGHIELQKYHYTDNWWTEVKPKNC